MEFAQTVGQSKCKFQINLIHKPTCLLQAILKVMKSNLTLLHDCHRGDTFLLVLSIYLSSKLIVGPALAREEQGVCAFMFSSSACFRGCQSFAYLGALHGKCAINMNMCGVCVHRRVLDKLVECVIKKS